MLRMPTPPCKLHAFNEHSDQPHFSPINASCWAAVADFVFCIFLWGFSLWEGGLSHCCLGPDTKRADSSLKERHSLTSARRRTGQGVLMQRARASSSLHREATLATEQKWPFL